MKKYTARFAIIFLLFCGFAFYAPVANAQQFSYNVSATPGVNPGQVTLTWTHLKSEVKNYNILFGPENNKSQFGAVSIDGNASTGKSISYTINYLIPGTNYFFTLVPVANGKATPLNFQVTSLPRPGTVSPPATSSTTTSTSTSNSSFTGSTSGDSIQSQSKSNIKSNKVGLHQLSAKKTGRGEVLLTWQNAIVDTTGYSIVYGDEPGKLKYGALHIGKTTSFTVKDLDPNKHYYFAIVPEKDGGKAQYITQQVSSNPVQANPSPSNSSQSSGNQGNGGNSGSGSSGSGSNSTTTTTTNTNTNTSTNTTNTTNSSGTSTGGTGGGSSSSTTTTTTTSTSKDNNTKNNNNGGQDKKVKGAETTVGDNQQITIWDLIKKLFGL